MKISLGFTDSIARVCSIFFCIYGFSVGAYLVTAEEHGATYGLVLVVFLLSVALLFKLGRRQWETRRYEYLIPLILLPLLAALTGLVVPVVFAS